MYGDMVYDLIDLILFGHLVLFNPRIFMFFLGGGFYPEDFKIKITQYNAQQSWPWVYVNSPISIPVRLAQVHDWLNLGGQRNKRGRQIGIFRKFAKSTY